MTSRLLFKEEITKMTPPVKICTNDIYQWHYDLFQFKVLRILWIFVFISFIRFCFNIKKNQRNFNIVCILGDTCMCIMVIYCIFVRRSCILLMKYILYNNCSLFVFNLMYSMVHHDVMHIIYLKINLKKHLLMK